LELIQHGIKEFRLETIWNQTGINIVISIEIKPKLSWNQTGNIMESNCKKLLFLVQLIKFILFFLKKNKILSCRKVKVKVKRKDLILVTVQNVKEDRGHLRLLKDTKKEVLFFLFFISFLFLKKFYSIRFN